MTLIVATLGPSTSCEDDWHELLDAGTDVFRFTASKVGVDVLAAQARAVRVAAASRAMTPELLLDLPGSKPRLTNDDYIDLGRIDSMALLRRPGRDDVPLGLPSVGVTGIGPDARLEAGDVLLVGDGEDALEVLESNDGHWRVRPLTSGTIGLRRGLAWPNDSVRNVSLTEQDVASLALLPSLPFDAAVISFVESAETLAVARRAMGPSGGHRHRHRPRLVAKVESSDGILALDEIASAADAVLIGRGDLLLDAGAVEMHDLVDSALARVARLPCPLMIGTQLLTSLQRSWLPHRSELSFVCDAMSRGVSGMMLAEETAASSEPARAVELLARLRERYSIAPRTPLFDRPREAT